MKEQLRERRSGNWAHSVVSDCRYGLRQLRKKPGFTAVAIFALALGIGLNTAVFTAYKAVIGRPVQARNPGEMVNLALRRSSGSPDFIFSYPDYEAYRDGLHSFSGLIAFSTAHLRLLTAGGAVSQRASVAESAVGKLGLLSSGASNAE